jgi:hypothetical protein
MKEENKKGKETKNNTIKPDQKGLERSQNRKNHNEFMGRSAKKNMLHGYVSRGAPIHRAVRLVTRAAHSRECVGSTHVGLFFFFFFEPKALSIF